MINNSHFKVFLVKSTQNDGKNLARIWRRYTIFYFKSNRDRWWPLIEWYWGVCGLNVFKPLWPRDNIWCHRTWATLIQVMACCLTAPSHYLIQLPSKRSIENHLSVISQDKRQPLIDKIYFENYLSKISFEFPRTSELTCFCQYPGAEIQELFIMTVFAYFDESMQFTYHKKIPSNKTLSVSQKVCKYISYTKMSKGKNISSMASIVNGNRAKYDLFNYIFIKSSPKVWFMMTPH